MRCRRFGTWGRRNGTVPFRIIGMRDTVLASDGLSVVDELDNRVRFKIESLRVPLARRNAGFVVDTVTGGAIDVTVWLSGAESVVVFSRLL